nr:hypothetical protein [Candidatus Mycoplasma haematolamae]
MLLSKAQFDWSTPKGFFTQIRLYIRNANSGGGSSPAAAASTQGLNNGRMNYLIQKASSEITPSSSESEPALIAEIPLTKLGRSDYYRFCLPEKSSLKNTESAQVQQQTTSAGAAQGSQSCSLKWFTYHKEDKENKEAIDYLLKLVVKFLQLQHAINMMYLFHTGDRTQSAQVSQSSDSPNLNDLMKVCEQSASSSKENLKNLLLSSNPNRKCYLPPHIAEITLDLSSDAPQTTSAAAASEEKQTSNNQITVDRIRKSSLKGTISYGLFDYWAEYKKVKLKDQGNSESIVLEFPLPLTYTLEEEESSSLGTSSTSPTQTNENKVSMSKLWRKLNDQDLKLEDFNPKRTQQAAQKR